MILSENRFPLFGIMRRAFVQADDNVWVLLFIPCDTSGHVPPADLKPGARSPAAAKAPLERFPFRRTISRIREVCSAFRSRDLIKTRGDRLAEAPDGERGILQSICGHFAQERLEFGE